MNVPSLQQALGTSWVSSKLEQAWTEGERLALFAESLPSTSDEVDRWGKEELQGRSALLLVTNEQTAGHGRHGRSWFAPQGQALTMTLLFKTSKERSAGHWPLLAGWSQFRTLCSWVNNQDLDLKWPNDLWLQERKVGGCLCTMKTIAGSSWLSIGIGINVGAMTFPSELENIATTLNNHLTNTAPSLEQVAAAITDSILEDEAALSSNDLLRNYSSASSWIRLKDITWQSDGKTHSGTTAGLSLSGALRVSQTGVVQELTVSEIAHVRSATS